MKETFDRAMKFVESRLDSMECVVLGCDIDSKGNIHLYSNEALEGYSKTNGVYENVIPNSELTGRQRSALHRYLVVGPSVRQTNLPESDEIYTKDLEADLFGVSRCPEYVFIPTGKITREFIGDDEFYARILELTKINPEDSILVHEFAHIIKPETRRKFAKRFGLGRNRAFSEAVQEEMFAKYTEMLYLQDNYPDIAWQRLQEFRDEIDRDSKFRESHPEYPAITDNPHGPDTHPPASKLYFAILENPELRGFVDSIYKNPAPESRN